MKCNSLLINSTGLGHQVSIKEVNNEESWEKIESSVAHRNKLTRRLEIMKQIAYVIIPTFSVAFVIGFFGIGFYQVLVA